MKDQQSGSKWQENLNYYVTVVVNFSNKNYGCDKKDDADVITKIKQASAETLLKNGKFLDTGILIMKLNNPGSVLPNI